MAVELNAHPERLDLKDTHLIRARDIGIPVVISTDSHRARELDLIRYGVEQARRAWLKPEHVLNTRPVEDLLTALEVASAAGRSGHAPPATGAPLQAGERPFRTYPPEAAPARIE